MNWLKVINEYWGIILFMAGLIFHALWTYFQVGGHSKRLDEIERKTNDFIKTISNVENRITSIDAKLDILLTGYHKEKQDGKL